MAILGVNSLTGCSSIPSFLGGSSDTPSNPTVTIFHNTNAPTSWVKNVSSTVNDKALRVIGGVNGTAFSDGGVQLFSAIFAQRTSPVTCASSPAGASVDQNTTGHGGSTAQWTGSVSSDSNTTTVADIPTHVHSYSYRSDVNNLNSSTQAPQQQGAASTLSVQGWETGDSPSPQNISHNHPVSSPHSHTIGDNGHSHSTSNSGSHNHTVSLSSADFRVSYVDVIVATKS